MTTWRIDSTAVMATRASAGAGKKRGLKNHRTTHLEEAGEGCLRKFIWSVTPVASHSTSRSQVETPATSPMLSDCWTVFTSLRVEAGHASTAAGSWPRCLRDCFSYSAWHWMRPMRWRGKRGERSFPPTVEAAESSDIAHQRVSRAPWCQACVKIPLASRKHPTVCAPPSARSKATICKCVSNWLGCIDVGF